VISLEFETKGESPEKEREKEEVDNEHPAFSQCIS